MDDQPFAFELTQRLTHRGAAYPSPLAEFTLCEPLSGGQAPQLDCFPKTIDNLVSDQPCVRRDQKQFVESLRLGLHLNVLSHDFLNQSKAVLPSARFFDEAHRRSQMTTQPVPQQC
jgi:hypothetical protein